ncbi:DUF3696 domain-containing protein [Frankia sp. AgB32]|uniref:DUF3696 domain-containing protein n=1 Tax=Frankia sp. AgB32 TaxID=631119 RepID=UPI00201018EA|nr:DUF3696 domain-containing protein [Frankia sp. AgB32]MCK9897287.1 DUF3696 domain-containing protein [Frankia sp. AgB32]
MISRIRLGNFKAFARLDIGMAPLTLLSGINATGKSTVLQALAILRQSFDAGILPEEGLLLNGELVSLGTGKDLLHEDYDEDEQPAISIHLTDNDEQYLWAVGYSREDDLLQAHSRPTSPLAALALFQPGFQYLRADRAVPAVTYPKSYEAAIRRGFLGVTGEHTVNYLRSHQDDRLPDTAPRHDRAASSTLLDQVTAWMQELCPGVNLQVNDLEGTDLVQLDYGFFGTAGLRASNRYRPTNVGFGLTYVLPVVVSCLTAAPNTVMLIENPEAHLHPHGQTLMGKLASRTAAGGAQVIMETHSDHVLNGLRISVKDGVLQPTEVALHYFHRTATGSISSTRPMIGPDGMLSDWPSGFFDEWDRTLDNLLS